MDLLQIVAAGIIIVLAVVAGACLAAFWHSPTRSNGREERPVPSRSATPYRKGVSNQAKPVRSSAPSPPRATENGETTPPRADRAAEVARLMQDRPRIQAAIMKGDAKLLYEVASEYKKLGFQHAAHELFEKAKWLGSSGEPAGQSASSQNRGAARRSESSPRAPGEPRAR